MRGGAQHSIGSFDLGPGRVLRGVYAAAVILALGLAGASLWGLILLVEARSLGALAAGLMTGVLVADLVTGVVHWACDTWGSEETRWLGPGLIRAFREHHREPQAMLDHDWIEVNGEAALGASVVFLLLAPVAWALIQSGQVFGYASLWAFVCLAALANQLHKWAHLETAPRALRSLQQMGVILSPERHAKHHRPPHANSYCISTGWLNGLLDTLRFWRALELLVVAVTGARARGGARSGEPE